MVIQIRTKEEKKEGRRKRTNEKMKERERERERERGGMKKERKNGCNCSSLLQYLFHRGCVW